MLHRLVCDGDPRAVEAEAAWRRYFSGCGFPVNPPEASDAQRFGLDPAQTDGLIARLSREAHGLPTPGTKPGAELTGQTHLDELVGRLDGFAMISDEDLP